MKKKFLQGTLGITLGMLMAVAPMSAFAEETEMEVQTEVSVQEDAEAVEDVDAEAADNNVLMDDENAKFVIEKMEDGGDGFMMSAEIENRSDKNLTFSFRDASVNGVMCDPYFADDVPAGMKSKVKIRWDERTLERAGIDKVTVAEFTLVVYDSDDWGADYLVDEVKTIYPEGQEAVEFYERTPQETDKVLFDNDSVSMVVTDLGEDDRGYSAKVYLVNKTDHIAMFSADDVAVNGYMCDPLWATTVAAGKSAFSEINWYESDFEENGITEVEKINMKVRSYDDEDYNADPYVEETFEIVPDGAADAEGSEEESSEVETSVETEIVEAETDSTAE